MLKRKAIFVAMMAACGSLTLGTAAQAQVPYPYGGPGPGYHRPPPPPPGGPGYRPPPGPGYRGGPPPHVQRQHYGWRNKGGRIPRGQGYVVTDYRRHGLRQPPRGYHWVRDGDQYLLAGIASGIISGIISATR